jgi:hypothetical protein
MSDEPQIIRYVENFMRESNLIEGITRAPSHEEILATELFLNLKVLRIPSLKRLVSIYQPDAVLRDKKGLDVRVGSYRPPKGGTQICGDLEDFLTNISERPDDFSPYDRHCEYEKLHPFTDGNGRSGRTIWAWHMLKVGKNPFNLSFLHRFYYQTLEASRT